MVFGKSPRMDHRRSSSSCYSTVTLVTFVAFCLVGVWMMTSSTIVPIDLASSETISEVQKLKPQNERPVVDGSSDSNEKEEIYTAKNEGQEEISTVVSQSDGFGKKTYEAKQAEAPEETPAEGTEDKNEGSEDTSENPFLNDEDGEAKTGEENQNGEGMHKDNNGGFTTENKYNISSETIQEESGKDQMDETPESKQTEQSKPEEQRPSILLPDPGQSELLNETHPETHSWTTQQMESTKEKEKQNPSGGQLAEFSWKLCNVSGGTDYIPCLDNIEAIKRLRTTKHYQHRERHCPEEGPTCLVPLPEGYRQPVKWPYSRNKIWYANVPHTKLADIKGHQNWIKVNGEFLTFPGGGTQFTHGALHYIDFIQKSLPDIAWGKKSRVVLDVGCGVASFGGFLFDRDVLTMSFAPKDEHEAQVQFALERGIPAISAVMGTKRLPFPSTVFDVVHCARCRVPWHIEGGMLLLELNRLLRPGGYFVWSATPVYRKNSEDVGIWQAMSRLTKSMCWELVSKTRDKLNQVGMAIYRKPSSNECYDKRVENDPPLCHHSDDPNAAWNIKLQPCMHRVPEDPRVRGSQWPDQWPKRLETAPYWLNNSQVGVYGQAAPVDFKADYENWKHIVNKSYLSGMSIDWSKVRNVMDMRSVYGGFAAALKDMNVWVMNVVSVDSADTLPILYERGLFGIYHNWCESFSTYPRTYDLLHADHLFSNIKKRCRLLPVIAEADRMLRPEGKIVVRDKVETISELEQIAKSLHWEILLSYSKGTEGLLCMKKTTWRPQEYDMTI